MPLAQRVRDHRFAKGWGPDELASRAAISRTALYQIESGRTEHPRAATVRRIAEALDIPIEDLLSPDIDFATEGVWSAPGLRDSGRAPGAAIPIAVPILLESEAQPSAVRVRFDPVTLYRERELERKFREILASPFGEGIARILEESHRLLPRCTAEMGC